jgi:hypothetical protein
MVFVVCTSHKALEVVTTAFTSLPKNPTTRFAHYLCVVIMDGMDDNALPSTLIDSNEN